MNDFKKQINFLLEDACVGIRYLIHRDFLGDSADEPFMQDMQAEILMQANVQKHLAAQHPDGWFGRELHGVDGMDCHINALLNSGVEPNNIHIQKAVNALIDPEISAGHKNFFRGGDALDAEGRGGNRAVIAGILSHTKADETIPILKDEISLSFEHLRASLHYSSVDDFTVKGKNERWYKPNAKFPGANHVGLLSATQSWRTEENMQTAKNAAAHAYELMKDFDEFITFKKPKAFGNGFVGPFNYNWQALKPVDSEQLYSIINSSYNFQFAFWLGAVSGVPDWIRQSTQTYELLADMLVRDTLFDMIPDRALKAFRQVMGIEPVWRGKAAKCDVTYAVLKACLSGLQ